MTAKLPGETISGRSYPVIWEVNALGAILFWRLNLSAPGEQPETYRQIENSEDRDTYPSGLRTISVTRRQGSGGMWGLIRREVDR